MHPIRSLRQDTEVHLTNPDPRSNTHIVDEMHLGIEGGVETRERPQLSIPHSDLCVGRLGVDASTCAIRARGRRRSLLLDVVHVWVRGGRDWQQVF